MDYSSAVERIHQRARGRDFTGQESAELRQLMAAQLAERPTDLAGLAQLAAALADHLAGSGPGPIYLAARHLADQLVVHEG